MALSTRPRLISLTLSLLLTAATAKGISFQRQTRESSVPPTGAAIAAAARAATLDHANAGTATMFGKPFKFTPVRSSQDKQDKKAQDENGFLAGVLENGAPGDETGLPPGKYNVFIARIGGQTRAYLESGGAIIREALRVSVTPGGNAKDRPRFTEKGWCIRWFYCGPYVWWWDAGVGCFTIQTCH